MNTNLDIEGIRGKAGKSFDAMNTPGTTVYAVAHMTPPEEESSCDDGSVVDRFVRILPRQMESFDKAIKMMRKK